MSSKSTYVAANTDSLFLVVSESCCMVWLCIRVPYWVEMVSITLVGYPAPHPPIGPAPWAVPLTMAVALGRAAFLLLAVYVPPAGLCYFRTYSPMDERKATAELLSTPHRCIPDGLGELFVLGGPPRGRNPFQLPTLLSVFMPSSTTCQGFSGISMCRTGHHVFKAIPWVHAR